MLGAIGLTLGACADGGAPISEGPTVEVAVAPLDLSGLTDACYRLAVYNTQGALTAADLVWEETDLCASDYGFGTEISYIGPCDASDGNADSTVELELLSLHDDEGAVPTDQYVNPCGDGVGGHNPPCTQPATCVENGDVPVSFNLTVMRSAQQGFFDIAVNFEDVFCSAKVDCEYGADDPITLVHGPNGERVQSMVLATACTPGPGADENGDALTTSMYMNDIWLVCDGAKVGPFKPTDGPGNLYDLEYDGAGAYAGSTVKAGYGSTANPSPFYQAMTFFGTESLTCDGEPCNKQYWNVAFGIDLEALASESNCKLVTSFTAAGEPFAQGGTPWGTTYGKVDVEVPVGAAQVGAGADAAHELTECGQHPMGVGTGVNVGYTGLGGSHGFSNQLVDGLPSPTRPRPGDPHVGDVTVRPSTTHDKRVPRFLKPYDPQLEGDALDHYVTVVEVDYDLSELTLTAGSVDIWNFEASLSQELATYTKDAGFKAASLAYEVTYIDGNDTTKYLAQKQQLGRTTKVEEGDLRNLVVADTTTVTVRLYANMDGGDASVTVAMLQSLREELHKDDNHRTFGLLRLTAP